MRETETEILRFFTSIQQPILDQFAWLLTFLGNETFYFIVVPFVYWCISKSVGIRLLYVFVLSVYINSFLKMSFPVTRPVEVDGVNSLFVDSAEVGTHFPNDSFPSGHAQGSATLWGYLAYRTNNPLFWVFALVLILLISLARLYTGVHWPLDIIVGMSIGVLIIVIAHFIEKVLHALTDMIKIILALIIPVIMVLIFPDPEGFKYAGFLLGAGIGFFIEKSKIKMIIPSSWVNRILAYIIGVIGIFALQTGLKLVFPEAVLFDGLRYGIMGLWGLWIAPYLFVKIKLYQRELV